MKNYVQQFPAQLTEALGIAKTISLNEIKSKKIQSILISGLGGSGISGSILAELSSDTCSIPVLINKDYSLPGWVNADSLVIICSYSGNTEETVAVLKTTLQKTRNIVCISSGGQVAELAKVNKLPLILIPGGHPPRASFAYPFVQLLAIFDNLNLTQFNFEKAIEEFIQICKERESEIQTEALSVAKLLHTKLPVIYATSGNEGIATRFRQQLNENSKMLAWCNVIPEMNHNELVGWVGEKKNLAVVEVRTSFEHPRSAKRLEICQSLISPLVSSWTEIRAKGNSRIAQTLYLIHLTDWVSCYLADLKNIDPVEVNVIDYLKSELSKF
jgi:glucose/mannose-6-phosphate isomerase